VSEEERINDLAAGDLGAGGLADGADDLVPHGADPDDRQIAGNPLLAEPADQQEWGEDQQQDDEQGHGIRALGHHGSLL
jgi:hypothetical protein